MNGRSAKALRRETRQTLGPAVLDALKNQALAIRLLNQHIKEVTARLDALDPPAPTLTITKLPDEAPDGV